MGSETLRPQEVIVAPGDPEIMLSENSAVLENLSKAEVRKNQPEEEMHTNVGSSPHAPSYRARNSKRKVGTGLLPVYCHISYAS